MSGATAQVRAIKREVTMKWTLRRKPRGSYGKPWTTELEGYSEIGIGTIIVEFSTGNRQNNSRFEITIDDFESLALDMIQADPEKAIKAFNAATIKAFTAAGNATETAA